MPLFITFPTWIKPEVFPNIPFLSLIRWYGLMYVFAFATAIFVFKHLVKEGALDFQNNKATEDDVFSFFAFTILCLLLGARIFSTLIYEPSGIYRQKPWLIFWPFNEAGQFTGLAGMSYHGGFIGGLLGMIIWCRIHKKNMLQWIDAMAVSIPLGYTFGRLGNFLNGELYGRITTAPWGVIFPQAEKFPTHLDWVTDVATQLHIDIAANQVLVNLPRHPSQLYEALFEGIILFLILWFLRTYKPFDGFLTATYTIGYGVIRFIIEYFREPDADLGFRIIHKEGSPIYLHQSLLNLSTGQILCLCMIVAGIAMMIASKLIHRKKTLV
ncbi:MAG TPA: prolipoprotein diacylglyceryl transferase [Treponemataceae bacterium]|nr:prolipoprotein diacylglyceryl transferase [Treponemataceae bacterium]